MELLGFGLGFVFLFVYSIIFPNIIISRFYRFLIINPIKKILFYVLNVLQFIWGLFLILVMFLGPLLLYYNFNTSQITMYTSQITKYLF